ncbi:MAG: RNA polymerase sigma factor [Sedimentisphaerales bacterium]|nr:RNA polymerase sigma factor [Sedimentisphaerales bacterium]
MQTRAARISLAGELAKAGSLRVDHVWVLEAMQTHGQALVNLLWRILGNDQDVCDAYQDTFLKLAHFGQNEGKIAARPQKIKSYLFRTAANTAISMLRRRKHRQNLHRSFGQQQPAGGETDYGGQLDQQQLRETLREYIARLPEMLQQVIMLHDLAEMPYRQVAATLGISEGTARVQRHRAIQLLSVWMGRMKTGV